MVYYSRHILRLLILVLYTIIGHYRSNDKIMVYKAKKIGIILVFIILMCVSVDQLGLITKLREVPFSKYLEKMDLSVYKTVESLIRNEKTDLLPCCSLHLNYTKTPCVLNQKPELVIIVKSAVENLARRNAIRDTWGRDSSLDLIVRTVFVLGNKSDNNQSQSDARRENIEHGDIIFGDFEDTYFNCTLKTLVGVRWATEQCDDAPFYFFVDDDVLVLLKNLKEVMSAHKDAKNLYLGYVFNSWPIRQKFSKWYISVDEYPYDRWPPYATAGFYLLNLRTLKTFYYASNYVQLHRFDDIYLSFLALHTFIAPVHCDGMHFRRKSYYFSDEYKNVVASHGFGNPYEMRSFWKVLVDS
ncbi:beta-1,3-galactosyltransferase brn-like isoform X2 [Artemia franciscana]